MKWKLYLRFPQLNTREQSVCLIIMKKMHLPLSSEQPRLTITTDPKDHRRRSPTEGQGTTRACYRTSLCTPVTPCVVEMSGLGPRGPRARTCPMAMMMPGSEPRATGLSVVNFLLYHRAFPQTQPSLRSLALSRLHILDRPQGVK